MKRHLLIFYFLLNFIISDAQVGISVASNINSVERWQVLFENYVSKRHFDFLKHGTSATFDYSFPINTSRFSLQPSLIASKAKLNYSNKDFTVNQIGVNISLLYQPLTEMVKNGVGRKLFFRLSTGVTQVSMHYQISHPDGFPNGSDGSLKVVRSFTPLFGIAVIREYTLTSLLSLSPFVSYDYLSSVLWSGLTERLSNKTMLNEFDETDWFRLSFGLRIGLDSRSRIEEP